VEAMLDANALELLVQRLTSLNEANDEEAAAVHHVLSIFENMVEVKPEVAELAVEKTKVRGCVLGLHAELSRQPHWRRQRWFAKSPDPVTAIVAS